MVEKSVETMRAPRPPKNFSMIKTHSKLRKTTETDKREGERRTFHFFVHKFFSPSHVQNQRKSHKVPQRQVIEVMHVAENFQ